MTGLRQFDRSATPRRYIYRDGETGEYWEAIGWITHPAAILRNMRTGEQHVEVIGCRNAERFVEMCENSLWEVHNLD
jgi:hypothetical protein